MFQIGTENTRVFKYIGTNIHHIEDKLELIKKNVQKTIRPILSSNVQICNPQSPLTEKELLSLRGLIGRRNWLEVICRHEIGL